MATRLSLTVSKKVNQNTSVSRFVLDAGKIIGLAEYTNGLVSVSFIARNGQVVSTIVDESYDTITDAIELSDYENSVKLGLVDLE